MPVNHYPGHGALVIPGVPSGWFVSWQVSDNMEKQNTEFTVKLISPDNREFKSSFAMFWQFNHAWDKEAFNIRLGSAWGDVARWSKIELVWNS